MASPRSPNGKTPGRTDRPAPPGEAEAVVALEGGRVPRADSSGSGPSPLNSADPRASNREQRAREADEDRALITQAQSKDASSAEAAFRKLVDRHQRRAFAIAVGLVRDENDAREIVQEAFLRVYRGLDTFEGGSSFFTWLYRIVTNLSIDLMRKPGRRAAELDEQRNVSDDAEGELALVSRIDGADPIDVVRRKEMAGRIQAALDALPPYHRAVIIMREVEGMSYEEMAEAMNVSKGTIMSRLFHARQKMQRALADVYEEQVTGGPRPAEGRNDSEEQSADEES